VTIAVSIASLATIGGHHFDIAAYCVCFSPASRAHSER